jgi:hypothetical protein
MTSEYSIELQAENINNSKTKHYFQEILSSYINGNYRSAIVVLWTVTVCDLIYKLQDLSSIYNDTTAEKILKEIRKKQEENKKSPEWEAELIKLIEERTVMFATYEISHIQSLHQQRHLSAHPIIKEDLDLYQPNKETTRALIRNTLEFVLTKPSMASNKIFQNLIEDLNEKRELFPEIEDFERYISYKYYKNTPDKVKQFIFKQLWKFIFKLQNENTNRNRVINLKALTVLYKQDTEIINQVMIEEQEYFAANISLAEEMDIKYFVTLCSEYPQIYSKIETYHKVPLVAKIKENKVSWSQSLFIYENIDEYLDKLETEIGLKEIIQDSELNKKVISFCNDNDSLTKLINIYIDRYISSTTYNDADTSFYALIQPTLSQINLNQFTYLLANIEKNEQVYNRRQASTDHKEVKKKCNEIFAIFDYTPYPNFLESIDE